MFARLVLLGLTLALGACAPTLAGRIDPAVDQPYLLGPGDKLRVVVFGQDGLSNSYAVDASGKINMPLIAEVEARDRTTEQLSRAIAARLRNGYVREPHVAVEVEAYRPHVEDDARVVIHHAVLGNVASLRPNVEITAE